MEPVVRGKQPHQDHFSKNHVWVSKGEPKAAHGAHLDSFQQADWVFISFYCKFNCGCWGCHTVPSEERFNFRPAPRWRPRLEGAGGGAGLSVWAYGVAALGQSSLSNEHRPGLCAGAARRRVLIQYSDAHIQVILTASLLVKSHLCACVPGGER